MTIFYFFAGWCLFSVFWANNKLLAIDQLALLAQAWISAGFIWFLFRKKILNAEKFFGGIVFLAFFESLLGLAQVLKQGSVGLYLLGEPHLDILNPAVAKTIVSGGGRLLRAYGTFPHSNILGAFLMVGLFSLIYLWINSKPYFIFYLLFSICQFFILLGLILTFSRVAWLVTVFGLCSFFLLNHPPKFTSSQDVNLINLRLAMTLFITVIFTTSIFYWAIFPKIFISTSEPSVILRARYLKIGWEIFKQHPLIGVGIGNQTFYAVKNNLYKNFGLNKEINWQPIHNIYFLIADELGIVGLVLFLCFVFWTFKNVLLKIRNCKLEIFMIIWLSLLLLGSSDHFLWTLSAGQLMFWTFGFFNLSFSARNSTDRMRPSEG